MSFLGKSTHAKPTVSVITPTYNRKLFLPMLIHLYQQQTYPKDLMELIILDQVQLLKSIFKN